MAVGLGLADERVSVDRDPRIGEIMSGRGERLAVQVDERSEPFRPAADDRDRQREPEGAGADDRLRRAADGDPYGQRILDRPRPHDRVLERGAVPSGPRHALGAPDRQQQIELLGEQLVVVVEVVAEQRERLREGPAPGHDLGTTAGQEIDFGELLEHADRIIRAQDGDRAREPDPLGLHGDRGERHLRRGDEEVRPVVLPDREHVETDLFREGRLLKQIPHPLLRADAGAQISKGCNAKFHSASA